MRLNHEEKLIIKTSCNKEKKFLFQKEEEEQNVASIICWDLINILPHLTSIFFLNSVFVRFSFCLLDKWFEIKSEMFARTYYA